MSDLVRLIAQPSDHVEDRREKFLLLLLRVGVVVPKEGDAAVSLNLFDENIMHS